MVNESLYTNPDAPLTARVADLVGRMTLAEKTAQLLHEAPAIERLGVPEYNWWNECLHGVGRAGVATVFPQAIGMAATWNVPLIRRVAEAISDEARAKHHAALQAGNHGQYFGLTYWTPNINIFRDPRWGRGHETWGEDPHLTARMGVAFVRGLQGDDPKYLKLVATPKHFAVHSGPENRRHQFDARVSEQDLNETYLPAFKATVQEARAASIMGAYNRTNGEPCCGSHTLLQKILRDSWGFDGYVVSDCGAICDFHLHHKITADAAESAAMALNNGCELNCGKTYEHLLEAVRRGLVSEATIDRAVTRLFTARFRLGMFDPPARVPFASIGPEVTDSAAHRELARETARQSIVLLKNTGGLLPLRRENLKQVAIVGPNAASIDVLLGNYNGLNGRLVTILEGICGKVGPATGVQWFAGCDLTGGSTAGFGSAMYAVNAADVVIAVMGLSPRLEGEEGDAADSEGGGDRTRIDLPGVQEKFLQTVHASGKPLIVVLLSGSAVAINWAQQHAAAVVAAWYPGEEGGSAVADVLFGDYNPAGRLPVTFYQSIEQIPAFDDYRMAGRTYRYFESKPLYPFGFGLSYTRFNYANASIRIDDNNDFELGVDLTNAGNVDGDEVVQVYLTVPDAPAPKLIRTLFLFTRVHLAAGHKQRIAFQFPCSSLQRIDGQGNEVPITGRCQFSIGPGQPVEPPIGVEPGQLPPCETVEIRL